MLAAIINVPPNVGYPVVFALIAIETMGIPVPGETALIAAALLAHDGQLDIVPLIALASAAAIIGDNIGFAIGRKGGRRLFAAPGPLYEHRLKLLEHGEPFFAKHGPKAVFLGRWVSLLRIASAWLAGINNMRWRSFLPWNALGGVLWACSVGFGVYALGHVAEDLFTVVGPVAAGLLAVTLGGVLAWRLRQRRGALVEARMTSSGGEAE